MTKLLLPLFFIFISLSSCSSDDDAFNEQNIDEQSIDEQNSDDENEDNSTIIDPLVGEWKLLETENESEEIVYERNANDCELISSEIYNSDGTGSAVFYRSDKDNDICFLYSTQTFTWVNNGDDSYTISGTSIDETMSNNSTKEPFSLIRKNNIFR